MSEYDVKRSCVTEAKFPPLPQWNIKSVEERVSEAEALRGKLSNREIRTIRDSIQRSEKECKNIDEYSQEISNLLGRIPKIEDIQKQVASYFKISVIDLVSHRRTAKVIRPRMVAMYLSKMLTPRSLPEIGRMFDRDHTTIIHAVRTITSIINGTYVFNENYFLLNATNKTLPSHIKILKRMIMEGSNESS